jgi:putative DNA primase/helicase
VTVTPHVALSHAACALAAHGLAVFPLHYPVQRGRMLACSCGRANCASPAKHPFSRLVPHGLKHATTDTKQIAAWWGSYPYLNVAVVTNGLLVIDVDPRHRGYESLIALEAAADILPHTWCVITGSNGRHIYTVLPNGTSVSNSTGRLGRGLDIRTTGGYVVAPPSIHISGKTYSWLESPEDAPLAPAPAWLIDKLKPQPPAELPRPFAISRPQTNEPDNADARVSAILMKVASAAQGERNKLTYWAACRMQEFVREGVIDHCQGMDALEQLRRAAAHAGLAAREINTAITSALRGAA